MHEAAQHGYFEIVEVLLAAGADPNKRESCEGLSSMNTPLTKAAKGNYANVVKALVDAGADLNATCNFDGTPLIAAIKCAKGDCTAIVKILIAAGANLNVALKFEGTALCIAESKGYDSIVQLLKDAGATRGSRW